MIRNKKNLINFHPVGGGGGGAGNPGGGKVELIASESITVEGQIVTRGLISTTGDGRGEIDEMTGDRPPGRGGNANEVGLSWGKFGGAVGGPGAGGGILLSAPIVNLYGILDARGGGGYTINGGTVKIFQSKHSEEPLLRNIMAGRIYLAKI